MIVDYSSPPVAFEGVIVFPEWIVPADARQPPVTELLVLQGCGTQGNTTYLGGTPDVPAGTCPH